VAHSRLFVPIGSDGLDIFEITENGDLTYL